MPYCSVFAIAVWAGTALRLAWLLDTFLCREYTLAGTDRLSFDQEGALAVGALALLLHLRPLWIGLRDDGEVARRLLDAARERAWRRAAGHAQDVLPTDGGLPGLARPATATRAPRRWSRRENSPVKALSTITWVAVILGVGTAYLNWNGFINLRQDKREIATPGPVNPVKSMVSAKPAAPTPPPTPVVQAAPALPMVNSHVVAPAPLPMVQRPTEMSASVQSPGAMGGANEAVAARGADGSFACDAVVNGGTHVRMLFDTGASVVGLRAEDATRIGIPVGKLSYSAKIKTANGTADVAPVTIGSMMIGNITLRNIPGFVAKQGMLQENLLGQTFLERLAGFNVEKNLLVLRGR